MTKERVEEIVKRYPFVHWRKNTYYDRKSKLMDKIYECCICRGYVDYEEIMSRENLREESALCASVRHG